jgi:DNA polymerase-4
MSGKCDNFCEKGGCAMDRVVLHSDMNYFYAAVECVRHPELRGRPVAVCGDEEQRHGIVLAKTPEAKRFGVATGEAIWQAKRKCPELLTVPAHYDLYMEYSARAREIYARYTDMLEPFGLDENWLDVTGSGRLFGSGEKIAGEIRGAVKRELGLTVSVGVSWNKIFAKLGSDYKKPDGMTVVTRDNFKSLVWPLPASDLLYVGPATTRRLGRYGIRTIGELAQTDEKFLSALLGKWGEYLSAFANGRDVSPVAHIGDSGPVKSIGNSMTTFRDIRSPEEAGQVFLALCESVAGRLRSGGFRCRTVQISVRDCELAWQGFQTGLALPCCTALELACAARGLFGREYRFVKPLRSLGVRACDLVCASQGLQTSLFDDSARQARRECGEACVDRLRERYGRGAVVRASLMHAEITGESDPLTHEVHPVGYFSRGGL